jgi:hypothetical protein
MGCDIPMTAEKGVQAPYLVHREAQGYLANSKGY